VNNVIVSINRRPVSSVADVRQIQRQLKAGSDVAFRVMRRFSQGQRTEWRGFFLAGVLPER
jgi:S1-C subfamily serine protease